MTNEATISKLREMHLGHMAEAFRQQLGDESMMDIPFEDRFGMLVDIEHSSRKDNRLKSLIRKAHFDQTLASVTDINYSVGRSINKDRIQILASCDFVRKAQNIILMGATGSGKSYIACALGMEACKQYYSVKYVRLPELLVELAIARGSGTFPKVVASYLKAKLLIIDEWMLVSLSESESHDLLEIVHSRHGVASTIFCSQFAPHGWLAKMPDATIAEAIVDRIIHSSHEIKITFPKKEDEKSMREVYGLKNR
jgi:DNA replication protein DnaC